MWIMIFLAVAIGIAGLLLLSARAARQTERDLRVMQRHIAVLASRIPLAPPHERSAGACPPATTVPAAEQGESARTSP